MSEPWKRYLRLGLNHHLLFPATFESVAEHRRTLGEVLAYPEFEVIDMFIPENGETAEEETALVLAGGKEPVYNCPLMNDAVRNPNSPDAAVRQETVNEVKQHLRRALAIGARKAVIASGPNPGAALIDEQTGFFVEYVAELCEAAPGLELLIEPFDRSIGKNLLIGSTREAAEVVRCVRERGYPNIGLLVDMGHVPLMNETFVQAVSDSGVYIGHVHLGSCVMSNPDDPLYGDMHPPWGYEGGKHDVPELIVFLRVLFASGYLSAVNDRGSRPTVTFEMRPYPGRSERQSVDVFIEKLHEAWKALTISE